MFFQFSNKLSTTGKYVAENSFNLKNANNIIIWCYLIDYVNNKKVNLIYKTRLNNKINA